MTPPFYGSNMFQIFHLQHRPILKKQVRVACCCYCAESVSVLFALPFFNAKLHSDLNRNKQKKWEWHENNNDK